MSGVAAVLMADGAPTSRLTLTRMVRSMAVRGPDGVSSWCAGPVALGFLSLITTPEAAAERQPFIDPVTTSVVVIDGRLDNREDLARALGDEVVADAGDAAYVAAAYRRWGGDAFVRLIGDFAVIIWDARERRMLAARDVMGVRPLCYARTAGGDLVMASEVRALLATGLVAADVSELVALEHLAGQEQHRAETLFRDIRRVPPAHVLTASATGESLRQFWDFEPSAEIRYRSDRDYAEHGRELIGRAVRAQARSRTGVGVLLSGGLDSSLVAAVAVAEQVPTRTYSVSFPGQSCDERPYIAAVAAHSGLPSHVRPYVVRPPQWYDERAATYRELPDYPNGASLDDLFQTLASRGERVVFTGFGGDEWFTGSPFQIADALRRGDVATAVGTWVNDVGRRGWRVATREAVACGAWAALPSRIRETARALRVTRRVIPPWIPGELATRVGLADRIGSRVTPRAGETFAQADVRHVAMSGFQVHSEELQDRAASSAGIECRHPLYDRRVMEFGYAIPEHQRKRRGETKVVLRAIGRGLLPESVRSRRGKAEFTANYLDAIRARGVVRFPQLESRGWIDPQVAQRLSRYLIEWTTDSVPSLPGAVDAVWMMHALESWLTHEARRRDVRTEDPVALVG